mmetsp:Transcript_16692/g.23348  ORF Transcript_16692/g.23348 Transcript_16692/m.23348 type:complete len:665 (-) Transcript_16692:265-2259(-)|eukprot:CAMPEP_0184488308 /NCGR_PEP_ID=MMETSP0113_2-20130426/11121_1 /TAXON_ID=91329 /ORGANISM="Norrisiella sphaerica, Strain BC52" /LENGTH=664 /DNA_ID=CAMNT_0026870913 /DNA_START=27 /DNA_END=2021 /DNA_ORIENTATION=-
MGISISIHNDMDFTVKAEVRLLTERGITIGKKTIAPGDTWKKTDGGLLRNCTYNLVVKDKDGVEYITPVRAPSRPGEKTVRVSDILLDVTSDSMLRSKDNLGKMMMKYGPMPSRSDLNDESSGDPEKVAEDVKEETNSRTQDKENVGESNGPKTKSPRQQPRTDSAAENKAEIYLSAIMQDLHKMQQSVNNNSFSIHEAENHYEISKDKIMMLHYQVEAFEKKYKTMGSRENQWAFIAIMVSTVVTLLILCCDLSQVPFIGKLYIPLVMLGAAYMSYQLVQSKTDENAASLKSSLQSSVNNVIPASLKPYIKGVLPTEETQEEDGEEEKEPAKPLPVKELEDKIVETTMGEGKIISVSEDSGITKVQLKFGTAYVHEKSLRNVHLAQDSAVESELDAKGGGDELPAAMNSSDWKKEGKHILMKHLSTCGEAIDCWSEPDSKNFMLRGKNYLIDSIKEHSLESRFSLECCELYAVDCTVDHVASKDYSALAKLRAESFFPEGSNVYPINFLIIQFQLPGKSFTLYMKAKKNQDPNSNVCSDYTKLFNEFVEGSDEFRNERFKIVPTVVEGSWFVRNVVGGKPALLGRKITCSYHRGKDYLEIDVDVSSSYIAQKILDVVEGSCKTLEVDLGFLIEGRKESELPEVLIGAVRFHHVDITQIPDLKA